MYLHCTLTLVRRCGDSQAARKAAKKRIMSDVTTSLLSMGSDLVGTPDAHRAQQQPVTTGGSSGNGNQHEQQHRMQSNNMFLPNVENISTSPDMGGHASERGTNSPCFSLGPCGKSHHLQYANMPVQTQQMCSSMDAFGMGGMPPSDERHLWVPSAGQG
jgi:hypothetical protein